MLPTDSAERKRRPITRGVLDYFPDAIAAVAEVSFVGNQQHNPGEPMHWARHKSSDHEDCIGRHLIERGTVDADGLRHSAKLAWRALALLQLEIEAAVPTIKETTRRAAPVLTASDRGDTNTVREGNPAVEVAAARVAKHYYVPKPLTSSDGSRGHVTSATRTIPTLYVAGPMRGYKAYNFPAFDEARDLAAATFGYRVVSPADIDRQMYGLDPINDPEGAGRIVEKWTDADWRDVAARDLHIIFMLDRRAGDAVAMLPGWEKSVGATAEFFVARWLRLPILRTSDFRRLNYIDSDTLVSTLDKWLEAEENRL